MKDISVKDLENNIPLISRKDFNRVIKVGDYQVSRKKVMIVAGPCTLEGKTQIAEIAKAVKESGATMLRAGIFKPLTFPYGDPLGRSDSDAQGQDLDKKTIIPKNELVNRAEKRLGYLKEAGAKYGLPVVSEILYADTVPMMSKYVDMFQVGYRHMFNMDLIEALAKAKKPILLKRHYGESLRSWLGVGEHFEARGKSDIMFCERGVVVPHTHNVESRAVIDIQAIPALNEYAPTVPILIDPSHATFKRGYVNSISRSAIAAGADGILIEVHPTPEKAWVDPLNAIDFKSFEKLVKEIEQIAKVLGKTL